MTKISTVGRRLWGKIRQNVYNILARSGTLSRLAVHVRRAASIQIRHRLVRSMEATENGEMWLISTVGPRIETAFDVGANIGSWAVAALNNCPNLGSLFCFEPSVAAADQIADTLRGDPRVHIVRAAVSDHEGTASLFEQPYASQTSSLVPQKNTDGVLHDVPLVTVDDEMARLSLDRLDFLKIDVEGYDLHALRGARQALERQAIAFVQFEYNRPWMDAGSTLQAAHALLTECKYELFLLNQTGLCRCDVARLGELFLYLNFVAIPSSSFDQFPVAINPDPLWG